MFSGPERQATLGAAFFFLPWPRSCSPQQPSGLSFHVFWVALRPSNPQALKLSDRLPLPFGFGGASGVRRIRRVLRFSRLLGIDAPVPSPALKVALTWKQRMCRPETVDLQAEAPRLLRVESVGRRLGEVLMSTRVQGFDPQPCEV